MSPFTDTELSNQDSAATRRAQDADWSESKPTKWLLFSAHAVLRDQTMRQIDVQAPNRDAAIAKVFASFPPCSIESVSAWPVRGEAKVTLDALSLRISPNPLFDSAFGCLC